MDETQDSMVDWAEATFGPVATNFRILTRTNDELAELLSAVSMSDEDSEKVCNEAADVCIVIARYGQKIKADLFRSIRPLPPRSMSSYGLAVRANIELAALMLMEYDAVPYAQTTEFDNRGRNIVLFMDAICRNNGRKLMDVIDAKMAVNRARKWKSDGSGAGKHIPG